MSLLFSACVLTACSRSSDSVLDVQGNSHKLEQADYWTFINYWAIWCKPCRKEVPELNNFAAANKHLVRVWAVNFDGVQGDQLIKEAQLLGFQFPVLSEDPGYHWQVDKPKVLPTTLVVQPDGSLHSVLYGPQTVESLQRLISNAEHQQGQKQMQATQPLQNLQSAGDKEKATRSGETLSSDSTSSKPSATTSGTTKE